MSLLTLNKSLFLIHSLVKLMIISFILSSSSFLSLPWNSWKVVEKQDIPLPFFISVYQIPIFAIVEHQSAISEIHSQRLESLFLFAKGDTFHGIRSLRNRHSFRVLSSSVPCPYVHSSHWSVFFFCCWEKETEKRRRNELEIDIDWVSVINHSLLLSFCHIFLLPSIY